MLLNCADLCDGVVSESAIQEAPRAFCGPPDPPFELFQTGNETNVMEYVCIGTLFVCVCTYVLLRARALACFAGTLGCLGHEGGARVG